MTALANNLPILSNSVESLPQEIMECRRSPILSPILSDSSPVLIVTAGYDHTIRFWDCLQGSCTVTLQHNESQVNCLSISPDKKFLAVAGNPNARIFDIEETLSLANSTSSPNLQDFSASTANIQAKNILQGHTGNITSVAFQSSIQWLFTASTDGTVRIWDFPGLKCQKEFTNRAGINTAILHPNQVEILIGDEAGFIKILDLLKGSFTIEMCPEDYVPVISMAISDDGSKLAMLNESGNLYVWLSQSNQSASSGFVPFGIVKNAHKTYATKCTFSPNSKILMTMGADGLVKNWAIDQYLKNIVLTSTLTGHSNWVWDAAFSADSSFVLTGASDNTARLWDATTGEMISIYSGHVKAITAVAINDSIAEDK